MPSHQLMLKFTNHKLLLCAAHRSASLGVLVCPHQQLDQSGNRTLLAQRCVIGWAKCQIADQTNSGLKKSKSIRDLNNPNSIGLSYLVSHLP